MVKAPRVYLDYNASAPLVAEARAAVIDALDRFGNASSVHQEGRAQRRILDQSRDAVAALCGAKSDNVVFTSGATEAAATVLTPDWMLGRGRLDYRRLLVGATEHPCVSVGGRFSAEATTIVPVDRHGRIDIAVLTALLADGPPALVAIQFANSETGVIQDITTISDIVHRGGSILVCDASQAAGRVPLSIEELGADVLIVSAHKLGGPKGAGALVYASDLQRPFNLMNGGGQEKSFRSGTENTIAIAGFGAASRIAAGALESRHDIKALRDAFESGLQALDSTVEIHGLGAPRLDNTTYFTIAGKSAETLQIAFDLAGIAVSPGSACSSGKVSFSPVLKAMGREPTEGAIRVSFGPHNTASDVERALAVLRGRN